jgi:hypothetical protein
MRVISLVPSLTETLVEAGVNVVGRTRFCVHPKDKVAAIPVIGGTKDLKQELIERLKPDLVVMDKEENTREMAEKLKFKIHATHVDSVLSLQSTFLDLSRILQNQQLHLWGSELREILKSAKSSHVLPRAESVLMGLLKNSILFDPSLAQPNPTSPPKDASGITPPFMDSAAHASVASFDLSGASSFHELLKRPWVYVIWKDPWMAVGPGTFIWSVFEHLGLEQPLQLGWQGLCHAIDIESHTKYPKFDLEKLGGECVLLLSTEPFPFVKRWSQLSDVKHTRYAIDGEAISWFGIRSLRFLKDMQTHMS